jgi:hypothetical protein
MKKLAGVFKYYTKSFYLPLFVLTTIAVLSCTQYETNSINMEESYSIEEGACGNIILNQKLGEDFEKAIQIFEAEKSEFYLSSCPDENPCHEIRLEYLDIEVTDSNGKSPEIVFKGIRILDKNTGEMVQSVSDVITSNGYHYSINWCPD